MGVDGEPEAGAAPAPNIRPSTRRRRWTVVGLIAAVGLIAGIALTAGDGPSMSNLDAVAIKPAKQFNLPDLRDSSRSVALSDFRGKPVVVNFWASWCVPCRKEMPDFERVASQTRGRVAFVGVNHQDDRADALQLLHETGVLYPVAFDPGGKTALAYGLFGMPTTLFISAQGQLVGRHTGQMSRTDLEKAIDLYLKPS